MRICHTTKQSSFPVLSSCILVIRTNQLDCTISRFVIFSLSSVLCFAIMAILSTYAIIHFPLILNVPLLWMLLNICPKAQLNSVADSASSCFTPSFITKLCFFCLSSHSYSCRFQCHLYHFDYFRCYFHIY